MEKNFIILVFSETIFNQNERWGDIIEVTSDQSSFEKLNEVPYQNTTLQTLLNIEQDVQHFNNLLTQVATIIAQDIFKKFKVKIDAIGIVQRNLDEFDEDIVTTNILWPNSFIINPLEGNFGVEY